MSSISAAAAYHTNQAKPSSGNNQMNAASIELAGSNNSLPNIPKNGTTCPVISNAKPLVRPTSKTVQLVKERRARLEVLEQLKCFLCNGYLIDATTVGECMDSFCRSCIVTHLRDSFHCPKCKTLIHKTKPLTMLLPDRVLQDIVYKLVPGLYDSEMERRRKYYFASEKEFLQHCANISNNFSYNCANGMHDNDTDDDDADAEVIGDDELSLTSMMSKAYKSCDPMNANENLGRVPIPKPFYSPSDPIDISIEPISYDDDTKTITIESSYDHLKRYLRCPAVFKISQLKKFITIKFGLVSENHLVKVLHLQDILQDDYTLIDMAYIYDWRGRDPMRLFYTITVIEKEDSNRSTISEKTAYEEDNRNNDNPLPTPPEKKLKLNVCDHNRVILQVTKPNNYYSSFATNNSNSSVISANHVSSQNFVLPPYIRIPNGMPSTPSSNPSSNSADTIGPKICTASTPVCSLTSSSSSSFSTSIVPIMSKCVIPSSANSITIKSNQSTSQPIFSQSNVDSLNHHTYSRIKNCHPTEQHTSVRLESNTRQKNGSSKNQSSSGQFHSNSKMIYPSSSNQNVKAGGTPVAFSFVTERGITIVRGLNRSAGPTTQTSDIHSSSSSTNMSRNSSKTSLKNNGSIVSSEY